MFRRLSLISVMALAMCLAGCTTLNDSAATLTPGALARQDPQIAETIAQFKQMQPGLSVYFKNAFGYAVFPTVGKGGLLFGGAYGTGKVYEQGELVGLSSIIQATIGLQMGGQTYSEIIFFKNNKALVNFQQGNYTMNAQASAVAIHSGVSIDANYSAGVAIFTLTKAGLMYEASVGEQKFTFTSVE